MNLPHLVQKNQIRNHTDCQCGSQIQKSGEGEQFAAQMVDKQSQPAAYCQGYDRQKNPRKRIKRKSSFLVNKESVQQGDYKLADQNPPQISPDADLRDSKEYEENANKKSGGILEKTQEGVSKTVQDTGEGSGEIQEGAEKREDADIRSGIRISIDQYSDEITEKEKDTSCKNSQEKTIFYGFLRSLDNFLGMSPGLLARNGGKQHGGDGIGDG